MTEKTILKNFTMQLFEAIGQNVEAGKIAIDDDDFDKMETIAFSLIDAMKIATPAPEPQEQVTDIYNTKINGTAIADILSTKIGNLVESCSLRGFDRDLPIRHAKSSLNGFVNFIFSGDYKKFDGVEFAKKQESIFDADGWCDNLDLAPTDGSEFIGYDPIEEDWFIVHYDNGDFTDGDEAYTITHWQPLPTLPKDKP